jgi:hypothetical protein
MVNYTGVKLNDLDYKIVKSSRNLARLGLEFLSAKDVQGYCRKVKQFLAGSTTNGKGENIPSSLPFDIMANELAKRYGEDYCIIPFKRSEREKYHAVIDKFITRTQQKNISEVAEQIQKNVLCEYEEI